MGEEVAPISHPYDRGGNVRRLFFVDWDRQLKTTHQHVGEVGWCCQLDIH